MDLENLPEVLGRVEDGAREAARVITTSAGPLRRPGVSAVASHRAFIPVTSAQWATVLDDAALPKLWLGLRALAQQVVGLGASTGRVVGRTLPTLLVQLRSSADALDTVAGEVLRFAPPDAVAGEAQLVEDLATHGRGFVQAVWDCAGDGWNESSWQDARTRGQSADAAAQTLLDIPATSHGSDSEDVFDRTLGVPSSELRVGKGPAFAARLAAAWSRDPEGLDRRMRDQTSHLLDDSLVLTGKVRLHLAVLAAADRPLLMHRAAALTRELVSSMLAVEPEQVRSAIAEHVRSEPAMLSTHRGLFNAWGIYKGAPSAEEQMRPVADMYKIVVEGDVKRTAKVLLRLLGRPVPPALTLATARELLASEQTQPLCSILASVIMPAWRNAVAHEDFHWDSSIGAPLLSGQQVDLGEILVEVGRARSVCLGFEHGVAIAYAQAPLKDSQSAEPHNEVARNLGILRAVGEAGQPVLDLRRIRTTVQLEVQSVSIKTLETLLGALVSGAEVDKSVERWEVHQGSRRPAFCVDRSAIDAVLSLAEVDDQDRKTLTFPPAGLPMIASGLANAGAPLDSAVSALLALAAAQVVGERDRLARRLTKNDREAGLDLLRTLQLTSRAVVAATAFIDEEAGRPLVMFAKLLQFEHDSLSGSKPVAMVNRVAPADRALRRHAPAFLPWIIEQSPG
ncbi:hypothetical protein GCM10009665_15020 [Kitasatospora nipponensis]|uniref:Uncharacterized protein n=1 Tax=Kitasatospora nipponensis TaxID=258049 RepID=A0ABP4GI03_9ACTN